MSTTRTGRDGQLLITTAQAAYSLAMTPTQFRSWARRRTSRAPLVAGRRAAYVG
ncbi:hypothetical protein PS783_37110 (plasmid) [Streptomyces enissocaesilis]|uniref:hypothetical protein n=1 Tax=Streptomyces TaxID=1883 RepID=UPI0027A26580|nr:hypothetical protein PS783_37110 [Streptomyces enissocaesilis]